MLPVSVFFFHTVAVHFKDPRGYRVVGGGCLIIPGKSNLLASRFIQKASASLARVTVPSDGTKKVFERDT